MTAALQVHTALQEASLAIYATRPSCCCWPACHYSLLRGRCLDTAARKHVGADALNICLTRLVVLKLGMHQKRLGTVTASLLLPATS